MRWRIQIAVVAAALAGVAFAQSRQTVPAITVAVLPFDNASKAPGLQWIGESFPEVVGERLTRPWLYAVPRGDRLYALDRAGVPANVALSRATLFRIAEQMDVDYAVLGEFNFDGQTFTATAQVLDVKHPRLSRELRESGPLVNLLEIETALAWDVLRELRPELDVSKQAFLAESPAIRLDAFENYVRGVLAGTRAEKVRYLKQALRLHPAYAQAMIQLGSAYYEAKDYEQAANWFSKIPSSDKLARQANFYLGLCAYYLGQYERAEAAFRLVASQLPLTQVYNNLGVVASRRGRRSALEYFQKAVTGDPQDSDSRFNLAVELYKAGDHAAAARQLREAIALRPSDSEARTLLEKLAAGAAKPVNADESAPISQAANTPAPPARAGVARAAPQLRIKSSYDESSFQQLALEIQNATEMRLAKTDARTHAAFHVERGRQLLKQGFAGEAAREVEEALRLDPYNSAAAALKQEIGKNSSQ